MFSLPHWTGRVWNRFLKWLQSTGVIGGFLATIITLLTASLGAAVSAILGIWIFLSKSFTAIVLNPSVEAGVGAFLVMLWTWIGIAYLLDRRKPQLVQSYADYRYNIVVEGFTPNFLPENSFVASQRGALQFALQIRSFGRGPIKYTLENVSIQIGTRSMPKYTRNTASGYIAPGGAKIIRSGAFPPGSLKEFYGAGEAKGTADFSLTYGPPDGPPQRRFKLNMEVIFYFPQDGVVDSSKNLGLGYGDTIVWESDDPIENGGS